MTNFVEIEKGANAGANGNNAMRPSTHQQNIAGNYTKGRIQIHGLRIAIENPRGSLRKWIAKDGTSGETLMKFHYGYFSGTQGADGDEVDVFVGPLPESTRVFVVNQHIDGKFDETKIMLGFPDRRTAIAGYLSNYTPDWQGMGSCVACSITQLKWWLKYGDMKRPLTQDQLPHEGTDEMEKVLWDSANLPLRSTLEAVLYRLRAHDGEDGLLFDAVSMGDILADADGVLALDALVIPLARIEQRMQLLQKVLDRAGGAVKVAAMQVSDPFTQRGSTNVAVIYELTDGQTVSVFFHNPDVTPKKIAAGDDLISWKWMLNKKDITVAVAPEKGRDLDVRTVAARIMALAEKNSARFAAANAKRAEKMAVIDGLKTELETKELTLADLTRQIEAAQAERDAAGLDDPEPVNPDPQPEPEPAPAPTLDVDGIKGVVTATDPMAGIPHGSNWVLMNAPRPLLGTETMSNGEFLTGRYYAAIDPADSMAAAYIAENVKLDARVVFIADAKTQEIMALNTLNPKYLPAYMGMDEDERGPALRGFIDKLHNRTIGELKALAAKGMPVVDMWRKEVEAFAFNRPGFFGRALELTSGDLLNQNRAPGTWTITKLGDGTYAALFTNLGGVTYTMTERVGSIEQAHAAMLAHPDYIAATAPAPEVDADADARFKSKYGTTVEQAKALGLISGKWSKSNGRVMWYAEDAAATPFKTAGEALEHYFTVVKPARDAQAAKDDSEGFAAATQSAIEGKTIAVAKVGDTFYMVNPKSGDIQTGNSTMRSKWFAAEDEFGIEAMQVGTAENINKVSDAIKAGIASRDAKAAEAAAKAAKEAQEAEEAADGDFLALAAEGNVDFYDKAVTDRLAALAGKYTDPEGAYLPMIERAKTAAKNWFIAEFKKRVG